MLKAKKEMTYQFIMNNHNSNSYFGVCMHIYFLPLQKH